MIRVNTNLESLTAQKHLTNSSLKLSTTLERLSSGLRINKSADDAAGLAVAEKLKTIRQGSLKAKQNITMGMDYIQTAEGGLETISNNLQRVRELILQAANDTNTRSDREKIQLEIDALLAEIDSTPQVTNYNTVQPLQIPPERLKELTTIPGSVDISFVVDTSASMGGLISTVASGLAGFIAILDAAGIGWNISVSEMGGTEFNPTMNNVANDPMVTQASYADQTNRISDFYDWTRTDLDLTMNAAAVTNLLNDFTQPAGGMSMNGYGLGQKRVDPYNSMVEVASPLYDTVGDPLAPVGLGIDRNGGVPGGVGDDFVSRRAVPYFQIVLADTIPESGMFSDGSHDRGGTLPDQPSLPGVLDPMINPGITTFGRDATNMPLFGAVPGGVGPMGSMNTPNFYGNQNREVAVATALAAVGAMVFVVGNHGMNFNPGDGTANRIGSTFYDDIATITGGGLVDIAGFTGADLQPIADQIVAQSLLTPGVLVTDPDALKIQVGGTEGDIIGIDQPHITRDGLGILDIDVVNPGGVNTDMENYWDFFDTQGNKITTAPSPAGSNPPARRYRPTPKFLDTNPPASPFVFTGYDDMIIQVDTALERVNEYRVKFGAKHQALGFKLANIQVYEENLAAAESRIRDTDYAKETANLTKAQILTQAGQSVLAQANLSPNVVLSLLSI